MVDYKGFRNYLWATFPESHSLILEIEAEERELAEAQGSEPFMSVYDYVSQVFWWEIFEPALKRDDEALVVRCYGLVEDVLETADDLLAEAVDIRVLSHLTGWRESWKFAGRRAKEKLEEMTA